MVVVVMVVLGTLVVFQMALSMLKQENVDSQNEQVPRGYIRCDYSIVTHCIIDYIII